MEIDFKDKKLRELCEQQRVAERKLGAACARKLRSRLADPGPAELVRLHLRRIAEVNPAIASTFKKAGEVVSLAGGTAQFLNQAIAVAFTAILSSVVTYVLLKLIGATIGLRVGAEEEHSGLDVSEHGESAYNE